MPQQDKDQIDQIVDVVDEWGYVAMLQSREYKVRDYFRWRESWIDQEDYDSYLNEDCDRRLELRITEADESRWQDRKRSIELEELPF